MVANGTAGVMMNSSAVEVKVAAAAESG